MPFKTTFLLICLLCVFIEPVNAAHITDKLVVGLYAKPSSEGAPSNLLSSGTPLEVLRRQDGFAEVRLADGSQGWVEANYVTEEKPAKAMLLETQARLRQMGLELAALREKYAAATGGSGVPPASTGSDEALLRQAPDAAEARVTEIEGQLAGPLSDERAAQRRLADLEDRVRQAVRLLADAPGPEQQQGPVDQGGPVGRYRSWIVGTIALLIGFGAGIAFVDRRIRRRYGGFRI